MEECLEHVSQRLAIMEAALELAQERRFAGLKVADVCTAMGMSRSTFYRYFSGMNQIPVWYQNYTSAIAIHRIGVTLTCRQGHMMSIQLLMRAAPFYKDIVHWWNDDFSMQAVNNHCHAMVEMLRQRGVEVTDKLVYDVRAHAFCAHQLVAFWMNDEMQLPLEDLVDSICAHTTPFLRKMFDSPPNPEQAATIISAILENR